MITIQVQVFASLKDYFKPQFEIVIPSPTIEALIEALKKNNPDSSNVLKASRIAIKENFVSYDYKLNENDKVVILPPSSGG